MEYDFRQGLLQQGVMTSDEDKLEAVLNNWIETCCSEVSWDNLTQVLTELNVKYDFHQGTRVYIKLVTCT